jgi:hypothetical protein
MGLTPLDTSVDLTVSKQPSREKKPEAGSAGLLGQSFPQVFDLVILLGENLFHVPISCRLLKFLL